MDMKEVLSTLVSDTVATELELSEPRAGLSGAQPLRYTHTHTQGGAGQQGGVFLSNPVTMSSQSLKGQVG